MTVPILMYHSISPHPPSSTAGLAVRPEAFAAQMALLAERGFTPVPFSALPATGAGKPVVITFDDGYADFHEHALPVLAGLGFSATVFVTTGWLADAGPDAAGCPLDRTLSWRQVDEAAAQGIEIGAHTHSHPQLDRLPARQLADELTRSKWLLEDRLNRAVTTMSYPYGYSNARVRRAVARAGYQTACAVANRLLTDEDVFTLPRLTVRPALPLEEFARVVEGHSVWRTYARERALTRGYAVVRRFRQATERR
jgi:peptidoglycan/xylan/chitin deacetylase (PgdA/CDA1 family)